MTGSGARHERQARQLTTRQGWRGAWTQTVLPPACRSAPPLQAGAVHDRQATAGGRVGRGQAGLRHAGVLPSLTSTRIRCASMSTRTVNSVRACNTALVASSFAAMTSMWTRSPAGPPSMAVRARRRKRRAAETACGSGRNRWATTSSAGTCCGYPFPSGAHEGASPPRAENSCTGVTTRTRVQVPSAVRPRPLPAPGTPSSAAAVSLLFRG